MAKKWNGVLAIEGIMTGDGRVIAEGALTWQTPSPLGWLQQAQHGDGMGNPGAVDLGTIVDIERNGQNIVGSGTIDDMSTAGGEFVRKLVDGTAPHGSQWGLSVDLSDTVIELLDTTPGDDPTVEPALLASFSGITALAMWRNGHTPTATWRALTAAAGDPVPDTAVVVAAETMTKDSIVMRLTSGRIRGVTACSIPAFEGALLSLAADPGEVEVEVGDDMADTATCPMCGAEDVPVGKPCPECGAVVPAAKAVAASGIPVKPPVAWFHEPEPVDDDDPRLCEQYDAMTGAFIGYAVPLTILDSGQFFGNLAPANRCHIGLGMCVTAPDSAVAYSHFHIGEVHCDDSRVITTGAMLFDCDHAPLDLSMKQARDHYAHTAMAWGDARVTASRYGPWVSGALRPGITEAAVRTLRGGGISGDWRGAGDQLELMAVQAVSVPGFTIQRIRPIAASAAWVTSKLWTPYVQVSSDSIMFNTQPVLPMVASAKPCPCGHSAPTVTLSDAKFDEIIAGQRRQEAFNAIMLARTGQFHDSAVDRARQQFRGG